MSAKHSKVSYPQSVDGSPLCRADLPPATTARWVIRHKANLVAAVRGGVISLHEACERYALTVEEFTAWSAAVDKYGVSGLRATRVQTYRKKLAPPVTERGN